MIMGAQASQGSESSTLRNPSPTLLSPTAEDYEIIDYEPPPPLTKLSLNANVSLLIRSSLGHLPCCGRTPVWPTLSQIMKRIDRGRNRKASDFMKFL